VIWTAETRTGLIALITRLLEIPVQWRGEPQQVIVGASAVIDVLGELGLGGDEITYTEGPTSDAPTEVTPTVYGLREATFQITVWSESQPLESSARAHTSRLRTRLRWPSALEELRSLGLGLVRVSDSIAADVDQGSRSRSGSALEVVLSFGTAEADDAVPFIEHVHVTSIAAGVGDPTITNPGGTPLPAAAQADTWVPELPEP
jgi:hypothetical protein